MTKKVCLVLLLTMTIFLCGCVGRVRIYSVGEKLVWKNSSLYEFTITSVDIVEGEEILVKIKYDTNADHILDTITGAWISDKRYMLQKEVNQKYCIYVIEVDEYEKLKNGLKRYVNFKAARNHFYLKYEQCNVIDSFD